MAVSPITYAYIRMALRRGDGGNYRRGGAKPILNFR